MTSYFDPEGREGALLASVPQLTGGRVLEIGAGDGRLTWQYAARARSVIGIDTDAESLGYLMEERPPGLWHQVAATLADAEHLPFAPDRFDAALLSWSL